MNATLTKIIQVTALGNQKLDEFGLLEQGWKFKISNTKTALGRCSHMRKEVEFSKHYLHIDDDEILDTILHEIAHALIDPKHGHDYMWKMMARKVGANPQRTTEAHIEPSAGYNYAMICPSCGRRWNRYRMRKRNFGGKCPDCKVTVKIYRIERGGG